MTISRRAFLASASAFSIMEGLASAAADKRIFAPNGGQAAEFLICRRLYLDICGRIPTPEEVTEYVNSRDTRKREKLVDALLDSDDFADYYAMRYCDFLRVKSEFPINLWPNAVYVYHHWIRETIQHDMPWNDFARTLLYSRGSNFRVPQVNFLRATARRTPEGLSEAVSTSLLLDPTEKYAKYFSRVRWKKTREWKEEIVYLDDGPADATPEAFMAQLEGPLAKQFFATPVQRVHWWIYGSLAPKSKCEKWVNAFRNGGYRLKPLLRHVFAQTEYRQGPGKGGFPARRMDAEVLDDVLCTLTGARRDFGSIAPEPYSFLPPTRKSVLVEDGSISSAFLILFGRPRARLRSPGRAQQPHHGEAAPLPLQLQQAVARPRQDGGDVRVQGALPRRPDQGAVHALPLAASREGRIVLLRPEEQHQRPRCRVVPPQLP